MIKWEYCECGCHGHRFAVGHLKFKTMPGQKLYGTDLPEFGLHYESHKERDTIVTDILQEEFDLLKELFDD